MEKNHDYSEISGGNKSQLKRELINQANPAVSSENIGTAFSVLVSLLICCMCIGIFSLPSHTYPLSFEPTPRSPQKQYHRAINKETRKIPGSGSKVKGLRGKEIVEGAK